MKNLHAFVVALALIWTGLPTPVVAAGPYFKTAFNSAKVGFFNQFDGPRRELGFVVPAIIHDKADGHWLIPGITWNLLDIGYSQEKKKDGNLERAARFGPSINLDEPVKAALRFACRALPNWTADPASYSILRLALEEGPGGAFAIGPSWRWAAPKLDIKTWQGSVDYSITYNKKFGGAKE